MLGEWTLSQYNNKNTSYMQYFTRLLIDRFVLLHTPHLHCHKTSIKRAQILKKNLSFISPEFRTFCNQPWHSGASSCAVWQFCIAVHKVKVTMRVQILREFLSWWNLMNHLTFCNETWYVGVSWWPRVSCKKFGFLSSRSKSQCGIKF